MTRSLTPFPRRGRVVVTLLCGAAAGATTFSGCAAARRTVAEPIGGVMRAVPGVRNLVPTAPQPPVRTYRSGPATVAPPLPVPAPPTGPIRGGWDPVDSPAGVDPFAPPSGADAALPPPVPAPSSFYPLDDPGLTGPAEPTVRPPAVVPDRNAEPIWNDLSEPTPADSYAAEADGMDSAISPPLPAAPRPVDDAAEGAAEPVPELPADTETDEAYYPVRVDRNPLAALFRRFRGDRTAIPAVAAPPAAVLVSHQAPAVPLRPIVRPRVERRPAVRLGRPVPHADPLAAPLWTPLMVSPPPAAAPLAPAALPAPFPTM